MTTINRVLIEAKLAENTETKQYPIADGDAVRTSIDKFTAYNGSAGNAILVVRLVAKDGTANGTNAVVRKTIAPGRTETFPELVGHNLEPGDFISTLSDTANAISIRASGRQFT